VISLLGRAAVLAALAAFSVGAVSGIAGGARRSEEAWRWSRRMAYTAFGAMSLALFLMEYALITHDFSVSYVAEVGSTQTPLWVTIVSLWSSLDGSILLWCFVLSGYIAVFARATAGRYPEHSPWALGVSQAIGVFFGFLVAGIANPFAAMETVPLDGPGPNPLLQNHILMVIHPPALYLGYVGMAVPFGMGAASLFAGKIGAAWSSALRKWTLVPWGFLSVGILLGGWWSYEVLGWGGYWAWDPVENASFLPWLTATAFLHSALIMERRDQLKGWAICLLLATFLLTLLGTFMTRSGVFNSVHSFTQSPIGPVFLVFLGICSLFSVLLLAARIDTLSPKQAEGQGVVSRESMFLLNNLLFAAFTFTVLIGTVYPLVHEAMTEKKLSIGEPYFNEMGVPISICIVFLMGVGPALPWGRSGSAEALRRLAPPLVSGAVAAIAAFLFGAADPLPLLSFGCCGFALATTLREFHEPAAALALRKSTGYLPALLQVVQRARRRFGGYVVHIGVIMVAVAVTGSSAYKQQSEFVLSAGESAEFHGYELVYLSSRSESQPHRSSKVAVIEVRREGEVAGLLEPRLNNYFRMGTVIGTPAVRTMLHEDLYVNLVKIDDGGSQIGLQVIIEPLVFWLWFGGGVIGLGTMISAWPRRRRGTGSEAAA
jgi:cytochrome c-type biogenesis protein CcmF